jgi:hypothetical protein
MLAAERARTRRVEVYILKERAGCRKRLLENDIKEWNKPSRPNQLAGKKSRKKEESEESEAC